AASKYNRIRHYRKLDKMEWILQENLQLYNCVGIADHLGLKEKVRADEQRQDAAIVAAKPQKSAIRNPQSEITIVIPCYNEQESLPYLANTLRAVEANLLENGYKPSMIFVDDKSKDDTLAVLHELFDKKKNVRIVEHETNRGVAAGIMTGLRNAKTEIVCSMDCDCTYDPHELVNMLPLMKEN